MKKEELKILVNQNLEIVKDCYQTNNNGFDPLFVIHATDLKDKKQEILIPILNIESRFDMIKKLGIKMGILVKANKIKKINTIFILSEGWLSIVDIKNKKNKDKKLINGVMSPSEDPNRIEVIISSGKSDNGDTYMNMYEIKKTWLDGIISVSFTDMEKFLEENKLNDKKSEKDSAETQSPILSDFWNVHNMFLERFDEIPESLKELVIESSNLIKINSI